MALVALLAVNLAVLAVVLMRNGTPAPVAAPSPVAAARQPAPADAPPAPTHFSPLDAPPVYAPEIPADAVARDPVVRDPVIRAPAYLGPPASRAPRMRDPTLVANDDKSDQEVLPSVNELNLSGRQALPELHLDVHVFATNPAERFVYINMRKYHEGATLVEGPTLERIRRDGVVLNFQGVRFVLPRQQ